MLKKVLLGWCLVASIAVAGTVRVQPGDTLGALAARYNTSVIEIMRLNHLKDQNIRAGQELILPGSASITVQAGDTLEAIAKRNAVTVDALRRANGLSGDALRPGQRLKLPNSSSPARTSVSAASQAKPVNAKPASAQSASAQSSSAATYVVQSGDTLGAIAKRVNLEVGALKQLNGLTDDRLRPGQVLQLKAAPRVPSVSAKKPATSQSAKPVTAKKAASTATAKAPTTVTVKAGDTLSSIAKRSGISLEMLRRFNNLDSDHLQIGQQLRVAAPQVTAPKPSVAAAQKPATAAKKPGPTSAQPSLSSKPAAAVKPSSSSKPASTNAAAKPTPSQTAVSKPAEVAVKVATPVPLDATAMGPTPTAPSDVLEDDTDYSLLEPQWPANINRNERLLWPLSGILTSRFGYRWGKLHTGLDIAVPSGTAVYAALSGTVQFAGWNRFGYGYLVIVHGVDDRIYYYGHNSRLLVKRGQFVRQGTQISKSGSTGFSTGPHLHFEVRVAGKPRNPLAYLPSSQVQQARYAGK